LTEGMFRRGLGDMEFACVEAWVQDGCKTEEAACRVCEGDSSQVVSRAPFGPAFPILGTGVRRDHQGSFELAFDAAGRSERMAIGL